MGKIGSGILNSNVWFHYPRISWGVKISVDNHYQGINMFTRVAASQYTLP